MSKIRAVYDNLDEVPEQYKDLYEEREGVARLMKIDGLRTDADIERLQNSLSKERELRRTADATIKLYNGSPDDIAAEMDALKHKENTPTQTQLREVEKLKQELNLSSTKVTELEMTLGSQKLKTHFVKEATNQGVTSAALEDVLLWGEKLFTVKDGEVVSRDESNNQTPSDWLSDLKSAGKKEYWFEQSTGSGAQGGQHGAATKAGVEHFGGKGKEANISKMAKIFNEDPERAQSLSKLAGFKDFDEAVKHA